MQGILFFKLNTVKTPAPVCVAFYIGRGVVPPLGLAVGFRPPRARLSGLPEMDMHQLFSRRLLRFPPVALLDFSQLPGLRPPGGGFRRQTVSWAGLSSPHDRRLPILQPGRALELNQRIPFPPYRRIFTGTDSEGSPLARTSVMPRLSRTGARRRYGSGAGGASRSRTGGLPLPKRARCHLRHCPIFL